MFSGGEIYWTSDVPETGSAAKGVWYGQAHFSLALKLYQVTTVIFSLAKMKPGSEVWGSSPSSQSCLVLEENCKPKAGPRAWC